jgi:hypothetical protein
MMLDVWAIVLICLGVATILALILWLMYKLLIDFPKPHNDDSYRHSVSPRRNQPQPAYNSKHEQVNQFTFPIQILEVDH